MNKLPRLSDMNIKDDVIRASFYRRIIEYIRQPKAEITPYTIKPDEEYRPDLVAWRAFRTVELKWLVLLVADIDDEAEPLPVGSVLYFPSPQFVRQEMRRFLDEIGDR